MTTAEIDPVRTSAPAAPTVAPTSATTVPASPPPTVPAHPVAPHPVPPHLVPPHHVPPHHGPAGTGRPQTGPNGAPTRRTSGRIGPGLARADAALLRLPAWRLPAAFDVHRPRSVVWTWVLTRAWLLLMVGFAQETVVGDVAYYGRSLYSLFRGSTPLRESLQEYPLPVFGVLLPQFLVGGLNPLAFALLFVASMLVVDAFFTRFLVRRQRAERAAPVAAVGAGADNGAAGMDGRTGCTGAVAFWIWFMALTGPLAYFRFDLVPAVLAGAAVVAAFTRPARAGALTAIGTALKLWPAALLPTMLVRRAGRGRVALGFVGAGVVVIGVSTLIGGWARLVSPLQWQSGRGLQIESIFALPLMLGRAVHPHGVWDVRVSHYKAWEIFGAGSDLLVAASTVATGLTGVWLIWLWVRAFRLPDVTMRDVGWLVFATVAVMTVVNKTLSPQYLIWLGGPLAVLLLQPARDAALRRVVVLMLVIAGLTQLIFPLTYNWLLHETWQLPLATALLVVRNALLVWVTAIAVRTAWRSTAARRRPVQAEPAPDELGTDEPVARHEPGTHERASDEPAQSFSSTA